MTTKPGTRAFLVFAAAILGLSACRLFNTPPSVQISEGDQTVENGVPAVFTATVKVRTVVLASARVVVVSPRGVPS